MSFTLSKNLLTSNLVLFHHLNTEDVIDFDVVSREAVVQEVRREHHVVALVPEFRVILRVEPHNVARAHEAETRKNKHSCEHPHENASDVDRATSHANKTREGIAHRCKDLVAGNPVPVCDLHYTEEGVLGHLSFSELVEVEELADETTAFGEAFIH